MMIGIFAGACKPCHKGHWKMITTASEECDRVIVFVSTSNRTSSGITINWETMKYIWESFLMKNLPDNVTVEFVTNPVQSVYSFIGDNDVKQSDDSFLIYGDDIDLQSIYPETSRKKYFPFLHAKGGIKLRTFKRDGELDVSSSMFRAFINAGDRDKAIELLPNISDRDKMYDAIIKSSVYGARKATDDDVAALRASPLTDDVIVAIKATSRMMMHELNWLSVKKQIMLSLSPAKRQLFSTRDEKTKSHPPFNEFEQNVRKMWKQLTGNILKMPEEKMMKDIDPDKYV